MAGEADSVLGLFKRAFSGSVAPVQCRPQDDDLRFVGTCVAGVAGGDILPVQLSWQGATLSNAEMRGTYGHVATDFAERIKALETAVQQLALAVELSSSSEADDHEEKQHTKPDEPGRPVDLTYLPA